MVNRHFNIHGCHPNQKYHKKRTKKCGNYNSLVRKPRRRIVNGSLEGTCGRTLNERWAFSCVSAPSLCCTPVARRLLAPMIPDLCHALKNTKATGMNACVLEYSLRAVRWVVGREEAIEGADRVRAINKCCPCRVSSPHPTPPFLDTPVVAHRVVIQRGSRKQKPDTQARRGPLMTKASLMQTNTSPNLTVTCRVVDESLMTKIFDNVKATRTLP